MKDFVSCVKETSCSDAKERGVQLLEMLNLQIKHLTVEQQKSFTELLVNHSDIFALKPTELGTTKIVSHHIDTGDHSPIHQPLRSERSRVRSPDKPPNVANSALRLSRY